MHGCSFKLRWVPFFWRSHLWAGPQKIIWQVGMHRMHIISYLFCSHYYLCGWWCIEHNKWMEHHVLKYFIDVNDIFSGFPNNALIAFSEGGYSERFDIWKLFISRAFGNRVDTSACLGDWSDYISIACTGMCMPWTGLCLFCIFSFIADRTIASAKVHRRLIVGFVYVCWGRECLRLWIPGTVGEGPIVGHINSSCSQVQMSIIEIIRYYQILPSLISCCPLWIKPQFHLLLQLHGRNDVFDAELHPVERISVII